MVSERPATYDPSMFARAWADRRVLVLILAVAAVTAVLSVLLLRFDAYRHLIEIVS
jgi:hypothetical protein